MYCIVHVHCTCTCNNIHVHVIIYMYSVHVIILFYICLGTNNQPQPPNRQSRSSQGPGRPPHPPPSPRRPPGPPGGPPRPPGGPSGPSGSFPGPPGGSGFGGGFGSPPFRQPSFGNTTGFPSPGLIGGGDGGVVCGCGTEAILLTVRNEQSVNKGYSDLVLLLLIIIIDTLGRQFYKCRKRDDEGKCDFFLWADQTPSGPSQSGPSHLGPSHSFSSSTAPSFSNYSNRTSQSEYTHVHVHIMIIHA